jgi:DNA ligase-associated metallophosphoesterase
MGEKEPFLTHENSIATSLMYPGTIGHFTLLSADDMDINDIMEKTQKVTLMGQTLTLHPLAAAFWEETSTLLLADLHLGKVSHFRKNGAAVPDAAASANLDRLIALMLEFKPLRVLFLGDLFHSVYNPEWEAFEGLLALFPDTRFDLVQGNHDILPAAFFQRANIHLHPQVLESGPFIFSHEPLPDGASASYNIGGHIHPGVRLKGIGKQYLKLPCFYFGTQQGLMPAFGIFTGLGEIRPKAGEAVYVIAGEKVLPLQ